MTRGCSLLAYLLVVVALVAGSTPRRVGDGGEYVGMSLNLLAHGRPWLEPGDVPGRVAEIAEFDADAAEAFPKALIAGRGGRLAPIHFWLYSLAAAPCVWLAMFLGLGALPGFALFNILLLAATYFVASSRLRWPAVWLLMTGPIVWWSDKAHAEVLVFALLTIAFLVWREAPGWALVAAGVVAAQYPPVAVLLPLFFAGALAGNRAATRRNGFWVGAVVGAAAASLHWLFNLWLLGRVSAFALTTRRAAPTAGEFFAVLGDPAIGLLPNFPGLAVALGAGVILVAWRAPRRLVGPELLAGLAAGVLFLFSFPMTSSLHHGGTPGMSRYALWMIPLAVPLVRAADEVDGRAWAWLLGPLAVASFAWTAFAFHPKYPELSREPSWLARYVWTHHPTWNNPPPEVFAEVYGTLDALRLPVATANCEKALLVGHPAPAGMWPVPCYPAPVPDACRRPGALCYANRRGQRFDFAATAAPGRQPSYAPQHVWPPEAEPEIRRIMNRVEWWTLHPSALSPTGSMVRARFAIARLDAYEAPGVLLLVLRGTRPGASVLLRVPAGTTGEFFDPMTRDTLGVARFDGPAYELWQLPVPENRDLLVIGLRPQ